MGTRKRKRDPFKPVKMRKLPPETRILYQLSLVNMRLKRIVQLLEECNDRDSYL